MVQERLWRPGEPPGGVVRSGFSTPRPNKRLRNKQKQCVPHSRRTLCDILEEGGDDVKSAWPLWAGPHTCYNGNYNGKQGCKAERIRKDCLSSDCSLQLGNMKLESLVIADQHAAVNMYLASRNKVAVGEPVAGLNLSRWKCTLPPTFQHRGLACSYWWRAGEGSKGHVAGGESKIQLFHFPSCSSIGNQDKPGTTMKRWKLTKNKKRKDDQTKRSINRVSTPIIVICTDLPERLDRQGKKFFRGYRFMRYFQIKIYGGRARLVGDEQVRIASTKIDGIGPKKAIQDEPADPNIIYEEPDDEASSSDKDVSDATSPGKKNSYLLYFFMSSVRGTKERCFLSVSRYRPHAPPMVRLLRNRKEGPGARVLGWGYRVKRGGGDRGRARNEYMICSSVLAKSLLVQLIVRLAITDVPLTQPGNGPEGTAAWGMSASRRKAHFSLWVIRRAALSDQGPGHKGPGTIQAAKNPGGVILQTGRAKPLGCLSRLGEIGHRSTPGYKPGKQKYDIDDAARFHFVEVLVAEKVVGDGVAQFYLERGVQPLDSKERGVEILSIGSCAAGIDDERRAAFSGPILFNRRQKAEQEKAID
ncbi:hypothetical protein HAX54_044118 [Datura stramonium]|uniref:Uncharacterized protein n=1 Tax=Datura stramonium TaxID=4076 RepID=A0ABS8W279_DATST|nr:hypothetical protein [Datura stramonium]